MAAPFVFVVVAGLVVVLMGACAPLPVTFYAGEAGAGRLSYKSCSLGEVPEGLVLARSGIQVLAAIDTVGDHEVVHLRYDVEHGHRVRLASREIAADPRDGSAPSIGVIHATDMDDSPMPSLPTGPRPLAPSGITGSHPPSLRVTPLRSGSNCPT